MAGRKVDMEDLSHKQKVALRKPPSAVNARLPELGKQFDPFAADCWMLGSCHIARQPGMATQLSRRHAVTAEKVP